jgi:hypothetical protein
MYRLGDVFEGRDWQQKGANLAPHGHAGTKPKETQTLALRKEIPDPSSQTIVGRVKLPGDVQRTASSVTL